MTDSLQATEAASAAVAKSPDTRVKLADIEAAILSEVYLTGNLLAITASDVGEVSGSYDANEEHVLFHLQHLTICVVVMRNGFSVVGKAAPADPANFNPALGRKFAREDAIRQLWPLMGYALRDRLATASAEIGAGVAA